jgi:hypothetical protein
MGVIMSLLNIPPEWKDNPNGYKKYIKDSKHAQKLRERAQKKIDRL